MYQYFNGLAKPSIFLTDTDSAVIDVGMLRKDLEAELGKY
ncbi:hypothetical protein G3A_07430 [Bacillus sp. 17376]|nr:hypothetical protein G3A_07430 [Bacillus sp. 17376]